MAAGAVVKVAVAMAGTPEGEQAAEAKVVVVMAEAAMTAGAKVAEAVAEVEVMVVAEAQVVVARAVAARAAAEMMEAPQEAAVMAQMGLPMSRHHELRTLLPRIQSGCYLTNRRTLCHRLHPLASKQNHQDDGRARNHPSGRRSALSKPAM